MTSQTDVFRRVVRDHMAPPPIVVGADASCASVVRALAEGDVTAAVVVAPDGGLLGILTEQDVTRRMACRDVTALPVAGFMTSPILTVDVAAPLYTAIGFMRRRKLRHMPVVGPNGQVVGMLDLHEALAVGPLAVDIDRLTHEDTLEGLAEVKAAQVQLAADLMADHVPAPEVQSLVSDINNDIYRRVLSLLVAGMEREGRGPPPVPFATIVMGSGGRGESYLCPDQDNGFILADYPDEDHDTVDEWFIDLACRMTSTLEELHFPRCLSGVMATSPIWRKTLSQWRAQIAGWLLHRRELTLQCCALLLDFRPVHGEPALASDLRRWMNDELPRHRHLSRDLLAVQSEHRAGVGPFGRLLTERVDSAHRGQLNLKLSGTLPLAEAVRLMAVRSGVPALGTAARINSLRRRGILDADDSDRLTSAFAFVTGLQLRQQIADWRAGRPVSSFVDPAALTAREQDVLRSSLRSINDFRARVRLEILA